jgi:hypothetical protein
MGDDERLYYCAVCGSQVATLGTRCLSGHAGSIVCGTEETRQETRARFKAREATAGFCGYRGRDAAARAMERSRYASTNPSTLELRDGSVVGVGDTLLRPDGTRDAMLYGSRGSHCLASEARLAGLLDE